MGEICENIYNNRLKETDTTNSSQEADISKKFPQLHIDINSKNKKTTVKIMVNGDQSQEICLSDEVVSQLSPFIEDNFANSHDSNSPLIEIDLQNLNFRIKVKFRLKLT